MGQAARHHTAHLALCAIERHIMSIGSIVSQAAKVAQEYVQAHLHAADPPASQQNAPAQDTAVDTPAAPPDGTPVTRSSSLPPDSAIPASIALQLQAGVAPGGAAPTGVGAAPASTPMTDRRAAEVLYNQDNFNKFDVAKDEGKGKGDQKVGEEDLKVVSQNKDGKYSQDMVDAANQLLKDDSKLFNRLANKDWPTSAPAIKRENIEKSGLLQKKQMHGTKKPEPTKDIKGEKEVTKKEKPPVVTDRRANSNNYSSRNGTDIDSIILHDTGSDNVESTLSWFEDPTAKVSVQYVVDRDGTIYQTVDDDKCAWHARGSLPGTQEPVNPRSIGIEMVNLDDGKMEYTDAQYAAVAQLTGYLMQEYDVPKDHVLGHRDVTTAADGKKDPRENFDWNLLWKYINA